MKLDDWVVEQHIAAGDWLAAVSAVAALHGVPPPCPRDLTISVYYSMPKNYVGFTMNSTKFLWRKDAGIYSGPSLAKGPWAKVWAIVWTTRPQHEIERLGNS